MREMNTAQRIAKNTFSLLFSGIISQSLFFIAVVYLARVLGPGDFGKINFAMAIIAYFTLIANLGLPVLGTREIARERDKIKDYLGSILTLRLCLALFGFGLLFLLTFFLNKPTEIKHLILLYGLGLVPSALLLDWAFQAVEKMEYVGLGRILSGVVNLGLVLWFIRGPQQLLLIPCVSIVAKLLPAVLLLFIFTRSFSKPRFAFDPALWRGLLKRALPIGLASAMSVIIYYFDTVMLGFMKGDEAVGYYNAAFKIILLLIMLVTAYFDAIFPVLSNYYKTSFDSFKKLQSYTIKLMVTIALPLAVGGVILAKPIMNLLYGAKYSGGVIALQILIWTAALLYINSAYSRELWACDKQGVVLRIVTIHAAVVLVFNFILIPPFGLVGASIASVFGKFCEFLMYYRASGKVFKITLHKYIFKPLFASVIMGLFLWLAANWNVLLLMSAGALLYSVFFYLMRGVEREEIILVKSTIAWRKN